jgi:hypothetical protein
MHAYEEYGLQYVSLYENISMYGRIAATAGSSVALDPDTFTSPESYEVALLAAGAAVEGVERVIAGRHAVLRQQPLMGVPLGVREMAAPHHEAADMAMNGLVRDRLDGRRRLFVRHAHW